MQDIIANSVEAYRNQEMEGEPTQYMGAEEPTQNMGAEEVLTQEPMTLKDGDIAKIATILTKGVEY